MCECVCRWNKSAFQRTPFYRHHREPHRTHIRLHTMWSCTKRAAAPHQESKGEYTIPLSLSLSHTLFLSAPLSSLHCGKSFSVFLRPPANAHHSRARQARNRGVSYRTSSRVGCDLKQAEEGWQNYSTKMPAKVKAVGLLFPGSGNERVWPPAAVALRMRRSARSVYGRNIDFTIPSAYVGSWSGSNGWKVRQTLFGS